MRAVGCIGIGQHVAGDPAIDLAERAAREALFMAGRTTGGRADKPINTIIGASKGAVAAMSAAARQSTSQQSDPLRWRHGSIPQDVVKAVTLGPHGYLAEHLRRRLRLGNVLCTVAACASSLTALHQARRMLQRDLDGPHEMLVVTSEAALLPTFIHSYNRLGVLPPLNAEQYRGSPLDKSRGGFMLAELAAAVVLRRADSTEYADYESLSGEIELTDTAIAAEAFDLIRTDPRMPALEHVTRSLFSRGLPDLIHPHATGTFEHDPAELGVYARAGATNADIYAAKGAIGHGLGAAGLVSLVIACLCAKTNQRPPMPWLTRPMESPIKLSVESTNAGSIQRQAIFAAGFGGHVAGAVVEKIHHTTSTVRKPQL